MEPVKEASDEREEGEIVEDELFEDVSDCSLTAGSPIKTGKSVSPSEILKGVCLSRPSNRFVRDKSFIYYGKQRHRIRRRKRNSQGGLSKKSHNTTQHRRASVIEIVSDSDDEIIDPQYAKQLRDALRHESAEASTNNSLKTRLKAFIDNNSPSEDDANADSLRDLALLSTFKPVESGSAKDNESSDLSTLDLSDTIDPELQELRLEALKSVIIKNHERRKRKANQTSDSVSNEYNGEASEDINKENDQSIMNNKKIKIESTPEGDPLLNNVNSKNGPENTESLEEDADILRAVLLASMSKNLASKTVDTKSKVPFEPPRIVVKPLIINVNGDSDSDTENFDSSPPKNTTLKSTVSEFLKRQRAEVEANVKKKSPNGHVSNNFNNRNDLMNKSVMKLLPRSQQLEYHKLKQQLINAHKRVKSRKVTHRILHSNKKELNHTPNSTKKLPLYKTATSITNNNRILVNNRVLKNNVEKKSDPTFGHLQNTLNDLQIRKNGRLQMKGKYRSLGPLLKKINEASYERQQNEIVIKKLLQEIQVARTSLANSHQNFTNLVQQLVKEKSAIDQGTYPAPVPSVIPPTSNEVPLENKEVKSTEVVEEHSPNTNCKETEENLLDPNDITKVFVKEAIEDANIPKYTSPLNYRDIGTNPLTTICPYDLLGVCKDKECPYVHYS